MNRQIGSAFIAVVCSFTLLAACRADLGDQTHSATDHSNAREDTELYTCGMHPHVVQEGPGQCPICGMDLTPMRQGGAAEGIVEVDPATMQSIGVRTTVAQIERLERSTRTTGTFESNETALVAVSPKIGGWIDRLFVDYEGARVRKGDPLFEIYSPELVATQEEFLLAARHASAMMGTAGEADASRLLDAAKRRLQYWDLSASQIEALANKGEGPRTQTVFAPANGTVEQLNVIEGRKVSAGETLMQINDLSRVWLFVDVFEQDIHLVDVGTRAQIELPYAAGEHIEGSIDYVYDMFDANLRTGKARISLPNREGRFKPGMFASVRLFGEAIESAVVVPADALIRSGNTESVILALGGGRFRPVEIKTGFETDGKIQVREGLEGGEEVVTRAQFLIDSEAKLHAALGALSLGHQHAGDGIGGNPAPSVAPRMPSVYELDQNGDGFLFRCASNPAFLADSSDRIVACPGETEEISLGAAQTALFKSGARDIVVDVERADSNSDGNVYQCPMDWAVLHDEEGRCEVCGMFLEPFSVEMAAHNLEAAGYRTRSAQ